MKYLLLILIASCVHAADVAVVRPGSIPSEKPSQGKAVAPQREWVPPHVECMGLKEVLAEQEAETAALKAKHKAVLMSFLKRIDLDPVAKIEAGNDPRESDIKKNQAIDGFNNNLRRLRVSLDNGDLNTVLQTISDNSSIGYRPDEGVKWNFYNKWIEEYNTFKPKKFPNFSAEDAATDKPAVAEKKKQKLTATLADGTKIE